METLTYKINSNWITVRHTDWSSLFLHEDIVLKNFIKRTKDWDFSFTSPIQKNLPISFFNWFEKRFPFINKISVHERNELIEVYRLETLDRSFMTTFEFNRNLPDNVFIQKMSIRWKTVVWYRIENWLKATYFKTNWKEN